MDGFVETTVLSVDFIDHHLHTRKLANVMYSAVKLIAKPKYS